MNVEFLNVGSVLHGKYRINGVIGQGGFGITYDGTDLKLDKHVAIKEYFPRPIASRQVTHSQDVTCSQDTVSLYEQGLRNFLREARNMAKFVGEANFVSVHDYFAENNTAYIIMEFVQGQDLRHYLKDRGRLSFQEAMSIAAPVMNALEKIHAMNMIHRDISPSNIMILPDRRVKLLDFGAVREVSMETQSLTTMSAVYKYGYSPIEQQTRDMKQGTFSDVYALCATIYQMLTGTIPPSPFARLSRNEILIPPSQRGVNISLLQEQTLMQGLAIYGNDRIQTVQELREGFFGRPVGFGGTFERAGDRIGTGSAERQDGSSRSLNQGQIIGIAIACMAVLIFMLSGLVLFRKRTSTEPVTEQAAEEEVPSPGQQQLAEKETSSTIQEQAEEDENQPSEGEAEALTESETQGTDVLPESQETDVTASGGGADETVAQDEAFATYDYDFPQGALEYNGHHYFIYNDSTGSWEDASALCRSRGGYMAVINDAEENEALYQYMRSLGYDVAYFGLSRDDQGDWEYQDDDSSSYRNWGMNSKGEREPNDLKGTSKYATMNKYMTDGHWDDVTYGKKVYTPEGKPYENLYAYICEWDG